MIFEAYIKNCLLIDYTFKLFLIVIFSKGFEISGKTQRLWTCLCYAIRERSPFHLGVWCVWVLMEGCTKSLECVFCDSSSSRSRRVRRSSVRPSSSVPSPFSQWCMWSSLTGLGHTVRSVRRSIYCPVQIRKGEDSKCPVTVCHHRGTFVAKNSEQWQCGKECGAPIQNGIWQFRNNNPGRVFDLLGGGNHKGCPNLAVRSRVHSSCDSKEEGSKGRKTSPIIRLRTRMFWNCGKIWNGVVPVKFGSKGKQWPLRPLAGSAELATGFRIRYQSPFLLLPVWKDIFWNLKEAKRER